MDMYQKRKMREEKNNKKEKNNKTNINWLITIYLTPSKNYLFTRIFEM